MTREEWIERQRRRQIKALAAGCTLRERLRMWWSRREGRRCRKELEKQFSGRGD